MNETITNNPLMMDPLAPSTDAARRIVGDVVDRSGMQDMTPPEDRLAGGLSKQLYEQAVDLGERTLPLAPQPPYSERPVYELPEQWGHGQYLQRSLRTTSLSFDPSIRGFVYNVSSPNFSRATVLRTTTDTPLGSFRAETEVEERGTTYKIGLDYVAPDPETQTSGQILFFDSRYMAPNQAHLAYDDPRRQNVLDQLLTDITSAENAVVEFESLEGLGGRTLDATYEKNSREFFARLHPDREPTQEEIQKAVAGARLRDQAHTQVYSDLKRRLAVNPVPTSEELQMGAYIEELEPQIRNATLTALRKGYQPNSSGFSWDQAGTSEQLLEVYSVIPPEAFPLLESKGVKVFAWIGQWVPEPAPPGSKVSCYKITFQSQSADLKVMEQHWNEIAELLPEHPQKLKHPLNLGTHEFREMYRERKSGTEFLSMWISSNADVLQKDTSLPLLQRTLEHEDPRLLSEARRKLEERRAARKQDQ